MSSKRLKKYGIPNTSAFELSPCVSSRHQGTMHFCQVSFNAVVTALLAAGKMAEASKQRDPTK